MNAIARLDSAAECRRHRPVGRSRKDLGTAGGISCKSMALRARFTRSTRRSNASVDSPAIQMWGTSGCARRRDRSAGRGARPSRRAGARQTRRRRSDRPCQRLYRNRRRRGFAPERASGSCRFDADPWPQHDRPRQPDGQYRAVGLGRTGDGSLPCRAQSGSYRKAAES